MSDDDLSSGSEDPTVQELVAIDLARAKWEQKRREIFSRLVYGVVVCGYLLAWAGGVAFIVYGDWHIIPFFVAAVLAPSSILLIAIKHLSRDNGGNGDDDDLSVSLLSELLKATIDFVRAKTGQG